MIKIAPSILSADFGRLSEQLASVEQGGADLIHVDVMDGHFVPNITFGPIIVSAVRRLTTLPLCVHLMIAEPWRYVKAFCEAGADYLSFHWEVFPEAARTPREVEGAEGGSRESVTGISGENAQPASPDSAAAPDREEKRSVKLIEATIGATREKNVRPGLAVNPETPVSCVLPFLDLLDLVVVMTVHPGFGGQGFMPEVLPKVKELSLHRETSGFEIEVDGGVNLETAPGIANAGATILAAGSYIFSSPDPALAVRNLRQVAGGSGGR
ncbi:MAG: hypothetical protein AMJ46_09750 [Latescibacteria bacterium DG_63]|nr:MAG: hypothetical protein AMJ46_09750 [Latescibacteria bacterium DG_63]